MKPTNLISISDCPYSQFKRAIGINTFNIDFNRKFFLFDCSLNYFLVDNTQSDHYGSKLSLNFTVPLQANNGKYVDPSTGHPCEAQTIPNPAYATDNTQPQTIIQYVDEVNASVIATVAGQYDFYYGIASTKSEIIMNMLYSIVEMEDAMKSFDQFNPLQ